MSNSIRLSPKYGVNPTIPICFWCGREREEIALMGRIGDGRKHEDFEAPMHTVIDFEPCEECKKNMDLGFTVIEATNRPNGICQVEIQNGVYPTGRFVVLKTEAAHLLFDGLAPNASRAFLDIEAFKRLFE